MTEEFTDEELEHLEFILKGSSPGCSTCICMKDKVRRIRMERARHPLKESKFPWCFRQKDIWPNMDPHSVCLLCPVNVECRKER